MFHSDAFKNYTSKITNHLSVKEDMDPHKLGTLKETVLLYMNGDLQKVNITQNTIDNTVARLSQDVVSMETNVSENIVKYSRVVKQLLDEKKGLIAKENTKLTTIKNTYEIVDRLENMLQPYWIVKLQNCLMDQYYVMTYQ